MTLHFFQALLQNPFLQNAVIAGLLAALAGGITGSFVVAKKISSISGSIAHSVLGGIGIALYLNINHGMTALQPIYGALFIGILAAIIIGYTHLKYKQNEDAIIAAVWAAGMAIGVIFASLIKGYNVDFSSFLFGNILWSSSGDLWLLAVLDLATIALISLFYYRFLAVSFDEEQAQLQGLPVKKYYFLLLGLISISIVILIQIIGIILVIALITIPPTIARQFSAKLIVIMGLAIAICALFNFLGTAIAYECNTPPGATIALVACFFYFTAFFIKKSLAVQKKPPAGTKKSSWEIS